MNEFIGLMYLAIAILAIPLKLERASYVFLIIANIYFAASFCGG